ncbi:MAG: diguanylate cyclase [Candidatus Omnitrophica bacterium]|nr:diguanylate cyclase [Candidatus Omnitrophota bacterium]
MLKFFSKHGYTTCILIAVVIVLLYSLIITPLGGLDIARLKTIDLFYNVKHDLFGPPPEHDDIVIISVDDASLKKLSVRWPIDRGVFAELINRLNASGAQVICLDFFFINESENPAGDERLASALAEAGNVLLASYFSVEGQYIVPIDLFRYPALGTGFVNKPRDRDFSIRRAQPLSVLPNGRLIDYSLEARVIAAYHRIPQDDITYDGQRVIIGTQYPDKVIVPTYGHDKILLNYTTHFDELRVIPMWQVLMGKVPQHKIAGKIVLIGATSESIHDTYHTPFGVMPGVGILANNLLAMLREDSIREVGGWVNFALLLLVSILTATVVYKLSASKGFLLILCEFLAIGQLSQVLFTKNLWWDFFGLLYLPVAVYIVTSFYKYASLVIESMVLRREASTDGLTGLAVYRHFEERLRDEFERAKRHNVPLALIICDIDHFKKFNDTYGHESGNIVLKGVASILKDSSRTIDIVARYGGEEFCAILPLTTEEGAGVYAEKLRGTIEEHQFSLGNKLVKVTISLGVAALPTQNINTHKDLISSADIALYSAKDSGRNRVRVFSNLNQKSDIGKGAS